MTRLRSFVPAVAILVLAACGGGGGGSGSSSAPPSNFTDPALYSTLPTASLASAAELASVTHHQISVGGTTLDYTATAGHLTAANPVTGSPEASFFYVAYTLDDRDPGSRPITFFYNGGPGSATVWLHLGSFGPKRLATGEPATSATAPFPLVDNTETLLDVTDMVFVDAVGSGLSEAIAPNTNLTFWGVDADAAVFRDFIVRYVGANNRGASPKFLFGESYGTTRSAVLAHLLETAGVTLTGVVLQSSILNYNSNCGVFNPSSAVSCAGYLPTYGAVGDWYQLDNPSPPLAQLPTFMDQMRALATGQYEPALIRFLTQGTAPDPNLLTQLANTTGLPASGWQARFNLFPGYYQMNLLPGAITGLYDARMSAPVGGALAREGDPSSTFIEASFATMITRYLSTDLQYTNPSVYVTLSNAIEGWTYAHDELALPDVIPDLAAALAQNPELKVLSVGGYHDLVTPFFQTERDLARLGPSPSVAVRVYPGGHMTYLDDGSRVLEKADLAQFYRSTQ
ncbi:MAG TPA: peptidase S10 [Casimicrobiaceae bacterium]|nr:peptidase S10 [Casimicrobiaceae bacterium]